MRATKATMQQLPLAARGAVLCGLLAFVISATYTGTWFDNMGMIRVEQYDLAQFALGLLAVVLGIDAARTIDRRVHPKAATLATCALAVTLGVFQVLTSWDLGAPISAI